MSVTVSRMDKTEVVFVEAGAKIVDSQHYCDWPRLAARHPSEIWSLQVDAAAGRAPSHTARNTMRYLKRENVQFIQPNM